MTETREQYRERLAWTAYRAFMDHIKIDGTKEYDELLPETKDAMHAEAEAVAAQVLRDVFDELLGDDVPEGTCCGCNNIGQDAVTHLAKWAAERGISLEDES